jgi:Response regulator receiver domain/Bacterial DNA-binding protein
MVPFSMALLRREAAMNKADLVMRMAKDAEITMRQAEIALDTLVDSVQVSLSKGDSVTLVGFGTFSAQDILKSFGYAVPAVVCSGEEAIQKVVEMQPDLVLMDIRLEGSMDGVEAAEKIRSEFNIPVVYLTAYMDDSTVQRAMITEPFGFIPILS